MKKKLCNFKAFDCQHKLDITYTLMVILKLCTEWCVLLSQSKFLSSFIGTHLFDENKKLSYRFSELHTEKNEDEKKFLKGLGS